MTARRRPRDRDGGYLLLEALATLALSALVLAGLLALGGGLSRAVDRTAFRLEAAEAGRRTVAAIGGEIARLARRRFAGEGGRFVFLGAPDRIVFVLDATQADGLAKPVVVAYQAPGAGEALRAEGELPIGAPGLDAVAFAMPRRLDVGGELIRFTYVEGLVEGGELITDAWTKVSALPRAVRIDRVDVRTGATIASRRVAIVSETEPGCAAPDVGFCSTAEKKKGEGRPQAAGEPAARGPREAPR